MYAENAYLKEKPSHQRTDHKYQKNECEENTRNQFGKG